MSVSGGGVWWRWVAVPWRSWSLAAAVIAATAAPALLVASADVWRAASEDDLAELSVRRASLVDNGVVVTIESTFDVNTARRADAALTGALGAVPELTAPGRTVSTFPGTIAIGPDRRAVGPPARLFARAGALDAITVVARLDDDAPADALDVWVTTWFAERHGLALDDRIAFGAAADPEGAASDTAPGGGPVAALRIVGLYEPLWSADGVDAPDRDDMWEDVPRDLVPVHIAAFDAPNFELLIAEESALLGSGVSGELRWDAPLGSLPTTFDGLRRLRDRVRTVEAALVGTGELGEAMTAIAVAGGRAPRLATELFTTVGAVESAAARLSAPIASAQAVGGIVGSVAMVAVGVFLVERRRSEFRLLASEGERAPTMTGRVAAQLAAPVGVGSAVGVAAALVGPWWLGPADRLEVDELVWWKVAVTAVVALGMTALTAGVLGSRTLSPVDARTRRTVGGALALVLVSATAAAWYQAGRTTAIDTESLDLVVVLLPVLAVGVSVAALLAVAGRLWRLVGRHGRRLPTEGFLALRRLAGGSAGIRVVGGALGLGVGLLVFAVALTSTVDRTVDAKLAAEIGGETIVTLLDDLPPDFVAPAPTTVIRTSDTLTRPGSVRTRVIAIDPDTFAGAVIWPTEFGADVDDVVAALSATPGGPDPAIPAVAIAGEPAPSTGAFGFEVTYPYRVIRRVDGFTGAGGIAASLLVSRDALDGLAVAQHGEGQDGGAGSVTLPTDRFRQRLITAAQADEIIAALDAAEVRYRDVVSRSERRSDPGIAATRSAFGYLGVIGIVAATAAVVSLVLSLSARRRARALTTVMTRTMGLSPGRAASVTVIELVAVMTVAVVAGFGTAPFLVRRLSTRFDPAPDRPPTVAPVVAWWPLVVASVASVLVIAVAVWIAERRAGHRPAGEVMRDAG